MSKKEKVKKPFYKKWWVWIIAIIIICGIANSGGESNSTAKAKNESSDSKETNKKFTIGQEVKVGKLSYTVHGVRETNKISSVLGDKTTEGKYVIVNLSVKNYDKEARMADTNMFKIKTADGTEYTADPELDTYVNEGGLGFFLQDINPNLSKKGKVVFELPNEAKSYNLEVSSGFGWSGGEYEQIKLK